MPTLPLHLDAAEASHPDASRRNRVPGGYEYWRFDAHDPATDWRLIALFSLGFFPSRTYLHQAARYRRHPTRHAPPIAVQEPSVYVAAYQGATRRAEQLVRPCRPFTEAQSSVLSFGDSHFSLAADESIDLHLAGDTGLNADLHLRPSFPHPFRDNAFSGGKSNPSRFVWTHAGGLYQVEGTLHGSAQPTPFAGHATHEHGWGGPAIPQMNQWLYGTAIRPDGAWFLHRLSADSAVRPIEVCLRSDRNGIAWLLDPPATPPLSEHPRATPLASDHAQRWLCTFGHGTEPVQMVLDQWAQTRLGLDEVRALLPRH
jgi:hypothetical protein